MAGTVTSGDTTENPVVSYEDLGPWVAATTKRDTYRDWVWQTFLGW
jgi:hypothetical protein